MKNKKFNDEELEDLFDEVVEEDLDEDEQYLRQEQATWNGDEYIGEEDNYEEDYDHNDYEGEE